MGSACESDASGRFFPPQSVMISGDEIELHVLAVDDSLVDRKVVERLLRTSSCKVTVAESGRKALQYLGLLDGNESSSGVKVNLILTDYSMPEMTGYELMKKIKESAAFREVPVVIMSSENILARIDRCLEEGAKEFILKPVKLSDVIRLKDFMMRNLNSYRTVEEMDVSKTAMLEYRTSSLVTSSLTLSPNKLTSSEYKTQSPRCDRRRRRRNQHRL